LIKVVDTPASDRYIVYMKQIKSSKATTAHAPAHIHTPATIAMVDLSAFSAPKASGKSEYPILPDADGETAKLVDSISKKAEEFDALEGALKSEKAELVIRAKAYYFKTSEGKIEVPSSILAEGLTRKVLVVMQNKYAACDEQAAAQEVMGSKNFTEFMGQSFSIKVDGDAIPEESKGKLVQEMMALFQKYNAEGALTAKSEIKPKASFHTARHTKLTAAQNASFDKVCKMTAMVKSKGVK
jgi:hypothetical protein